MILQLLNQLLTFVLCSLFKYALHLITSKSELARILDINHIKYPNDYVANSSVCYSILVCLENSRALKTAYKLFSNGKLEVELFMDLLIRKKLNLHKTPQLQLFVLKSALTKISEMKKMLLQIEAERSSSYDCNNLVHENKLTQVINWDFWPRSLYHRHFVAMDKFQTRRPPSF